MRQGAPHNFRLLMNFFGHKVPVIALIDMIGTRLRFLLSAINKPVCAVAKFGGVAGKNDPITVFKISDLVGEGRKRKRIRSKIHLAVAIAYGERRALAGTNEQITLAFE